MTTVSTIHHARGHVGDIVIPLAHSPRRLLRRCSAGGWMEGFVCRPVSKAGGECACNARSMPALPDARPPAALRSLCANPRTDIAANELCYRGISAAAATRDMTPPRTPPVADAFRRRPATCWDGSKPNVRRAGALPAPASAPADGLQTAAPSRRRRDLVDYTCAPTPPRSIARPAIDRRQPLVGWA